MAILAVMVVRALWRLSHREPPQPVALSASLRTVSRVTHASLYALLVALPLLGAAYASARSSPVTLFGILPVPPLTPRGSPLGRQLADVH